MTILSNTLDLDRVAFFIPYFRLPVYWYGILFALGFFLSSIFLKILVSDGQKNKNKLAEELVHSLSGYILIAVILGARIFHVAFYEGVGKLFNFYHLINLRDGGLASHGAIFFIMIGYLLFTLKKKKLIESLNLDNKRIFDFLCLSSLINASFIRVGNFLNQEILGKSTDSFLGVVFMRPIGDYIVCKRHPVQLYEAVFYVCLFCFLLWILKRKQIFQSSGVLTGVFFFLMFSFRIWIEQFKEVQSVYDNQFNMMGVYLSIPFLIGSIIYTIFSLRSKIYS